MKYTTAFAILAGLATVSARPSHISPRRFGQENAVQLGQKLNAVTGCNIAGTSDKTLGFNNQEIATLLANKGACEKIQMADQIVAKFQAEGNCNAQGMQQVLAAAMDLVVAERNFNPFNGDEDSICTDPALPATPELR
ncbi:hypothetical protein HK102_002392, partial [Quaeritorhiza haematococci]